VLTPSAVSLDETGHLLVGLPARERISTQPQHTATAFKRWMGNLVTLLSIAVIWVMLSSALMEKTPHALEAVWLAIKQAIREHPVRSLFYGLIGFKLVFLMGVFLVIAATPYVCFRIAHNHSVLRAYFVIGAANMLAFYVGQEHSMQYVFVWLMVTNALLVWLQVAAMYVGKILVRQGAGQSAKLLSE
jgi:hypothetical protein